jgi:anthranilate phosphoribosyltransferase
MKSHDLIARPHEHAFAPYVRMLGKGKTGSRSLQRDEARAAMTMILRGDVEPEQLGAFLMLLRVKEETADELTGFVEAARAAIAVPQDIAVDLDWSSYAGKRRQLPWFLLAAFTLSDLGLRVFMHGTGGHTAGRLYTESALAALGVHIANSWKDVAHQLDRDNFAFMPLQALCPPLQRMIELRNVLGLRSPVHTLARLLNPLAAPCSVQSIFHPPYALKHQHAELALEQPRAAVFKGEGGEVERKPEATCTVYGVNAGVLTEEVWPKLTDGRQEQPETLDIEHLRAVWRGDQHDEYGELAVTGTLAIVLKLMGRAEDQAHAMQLARLAWTQRNRARLG